MRAWNPAWWHPYESFWSLANKLAFAAAVAVNQVVAYLLGKQVRNRRSLVWFNDPAVYLNVCNALGLDSAATAHLFWNTDWPTDQERACLSLGVRWCPECIVHGFHSAQFQDSRVLLCPQHGCEIRDVCPKCRWPLDPLMEHSWTCGNCGHRLYSPPKAWPAAFRADVQFEASAAVRSWELTEEGEAGVLSLLAPGWTPGLGQGDSSWHLQSLAAFAAYEESGALFDQELWAHHATAANEVPAAPLSYGRVQFSDPLSAAVNHVAAWFGSATEAMAGQWPIRRGTSAHPNLPWTLSQAPPWARFQVARTLYRAWVHAAAQDFLSAMADSRETQWRPPAEIDPVYLVRGDGAVLLPGHRRLPV